MTRRLMLLEWYGSFINCAMAVLVRGTVELGQLVCDELEGAGKGPGPGAVGSDDGERSLEKERSMADSGCVSNVGDVRKLVSCENLQLRLPANTNA
jgi:hypothetical protein